MSYVCAKSVQIDIIWSWMIVPWFKMFCDVEGLKAFCLESKGLNFNFTLIVFFPVWSWHLIINTFCFEYQNFLQNVAHLHLCEMVKHWPKIQKRGFFCNYQGLYFNWKIHGFSKDIFRKWFYNLIYRTLITSAVKQYPLHNHSAWIAICKST